MKGTVKKTRKLSKTGVVVDTYEVQIFGTPHELDGVEEFVDQYTLTHGCFPIIMSIGPSRLTMLLWADNDVHVALLVQLQLDGTIEWIEG